MRKPRRFGRLPVVTSFRLEDYMEGGHAIPLPGAEAVEFSGLEMLSSDTVGDSAAAGVAHIFTNCWPDDAEPVSDGQLDEIYAALSGEQPVLDLEAMREELR
jgi:hypothetical protein